MKKILLFASALLLSVAAFADGTKYCEKSMTSGGNAISVTCEKIDNVPVMKIVGTSLNGLGGSFFHPDGTTGSTDLRNRITSSTSTEIIITFDDPGDTNPQLFTPLYVLMPGEVNFGNPSPIDWTAKCQKEECLLTVNPTMTSAELSGEPGTTKVNLAVAGTDQNSDAITTFVVKSTSFTDKVLDADEGIITIEALNQDTEYTVEVFAKDTCNNISDAGIEVTFTTAELTSECSGQRGHFATPENVKINFQFISDSPSVGQVTVKITPVDPEDPIDFAEIQYPGGVAMEINEEGSEASVVLTEPAGTVPVRFLYSLESMPGNEMTCDNPVALTTPNVIVYMPGGCQSTSAEEVAATSKSGAYKIIDAEGNIIIVAGDQQFNLLGVPLK